ncbi:phosphoglucomutase/phosphomannomutase family protein [Collinsella ihumii]|uniref:Phosphoglucomutase/phosphomannomutase family protein n=1 Tax=Collinsella ihumii TaxID=1720204 RepID=A0AAW7JZW4_9ACTN|nr:phosphoglucomutase/phosphomannomutase family protein [Collinsella ihumii]MDN0069015.1 phosphoglucomutase/phosphomannomutase family protein [Collinsella ihumii]
MGAMIRFGTDGWRARRDGEFTEENVVRVADAAASLWAQSHPGAIVYVGYDTRPGADEFARLAARVIAGHGLVVKLSDRYTPTPALSWTISHDARSCGGLMITGSHHPADYLGVKFRVADGGAGSTEFVSEVERAVGPEPTDLRGPIDIVDFTTPYLDALVSLVDGDAIANAHLHIVYDPMYGAARGYLPAVLGALGVEVDEIHGESDEDMEDMRPEPIEPWVDDCEQAVVEAGACCGLINDGDADRVGAVDEKGRFVNAHKLFSLILGHLVRNRGMSGRVVLGLASSLLTRRVARALGCRYVVKPVGFKYIYMEMLKGGVLIGGEETGGFGIPSHFPERDGLLMALLLCELMAKSGKTLAELVEELEDALGSTSYARRDLRLQYEDIEALRTMLPGINPRRVAGREPVRVSHMDGLRLEFEDESWLLLRPSGTETLVRVYAEAQTVEMRDELLDAGTDMAHLKFD